MTTHKSLNEIKAVLRKHKEELKEEYGVKKIGVFGSYVRNEQNTSSDIDILVEFYPHANVDLVKFVELKSYLSDLLSMKVDLVMKTALKPRIGAHILKEVIYV